MMGMAGQVFVGTRSHTFIGLMFLLAAGSCDTLAESAGKQDSNPGLPPVETRVKHALEQLGYRHETAEVDGQVVNVEGDRRFSVEELLQRVPAHADPPPRGTTFRSRSGQECSVSGCAPTAGLKIWISDDFPDPHRLFLEGAVADWASVGAPVEIVESRERANADALWLTSAPPWDSAAFWSRSTIVSVVPKLWQDEYLPTTNLVPRLGLFVNGASTYWNRADPGQSQAPEHCKADTDTGARYLYRHNVGHLLGLEHSNNVKHPPVFEPAPSVVSMCMEALYDFSSPGLTEADRRDIEYMYADSRDPGGASCSDEPPDSQNTCPDLASWGACGEDWMSGSCDASCGRCDEPDGTSTGDSDDGGADATSGGTTGGTSGPDHCTDEAPDTRHTCEEQAAWRKCDESFMQGFCDRSCGRCEGETPDPDPGPVPDPDPDPDADPDPDPSGPDPECTDVPPDDVHSCAEQSTWGKCGEPFMQGFCDNSCGRCGAPPCTDLAPPDGGSCAAQRSWGKCDAEWMRQGGYCRRTCGLC